ncbi:hypothetical protein M2119_000861 [Aurantimicrobium minutum]|uniref:beta strand repeat-containing protein n=1 Tax=Aurantimicrobium minutum TaxID=708131 RepID=UPI002475120F|nr:fibronectin type III domain-containing protein [Aurantimicrobium minutum]MDH6532624.1 hypothetical protein [Aurantimicrobium minutum]
MKSSTLSVTRIFHSRTNQWISGLFAIVLFTAGLVAFTPIAASAAVPTAPTITDVDQIDQGLTITFTAPSGVTPSISNYEYSVDGGATWTASNPAVTSSPITITGLNNCQTYSISLRAVNADGAGVAAEPWNGVPGALQYVLNNGLMRFGTGAEASVQTNGNLKQPWYKNSSGGWSPMTFSNYALNYGLAVGGDGSSEWNANGSLVEFNGVTLERQTIDCSQFVTTSTSGNLATGYGSLSTTGRYTFPGSGEVVEISRKYTQSLTSKYTTFTETIRNVGLVPMRNARLWVGTQDDWIGSDDRNTKKRGNISNGAFVQIPQSSTQAKVLEISNASDTVYFYTTSNLGYVTGLNGYGDFTQRVMRQNPGTALTSVYNDGSYGMYLRFQDLDPGASESFNWYYLASSSAEAANLLGNVASSALPGAPSISSVDAGDGQVSVDFVEGTTGGSGLTNYQYSTDSGATWQTRSPASISSPLVINGLTNGTSYDVKIRAVNSEGAGTSTSSTPVIPIGAPQAPQITSLSQTDTSVTVSFNAPGSDGGSAITSYQHSSDGGNTWISPTPAVTSSPVTITGLMPGTQYQIAVRAVNAQGDGISSASQSVTTYTAPGAPTVGAITPGNQSLSISFVSGTSGGTPYTNIEYSLDGGASWNTRSPTSTDSPLIVSGLTNGTSYDVALRTVNSVGHSVRSNIVTAEPVAVPAAITFPQGTNVTPSSGTLTLTFAAPDNGGSPITGYQYSTDLGVTWRDRTDSGGTSTTLTISKLSVDGATDLANGTAYRVQVRAVNSVGPGLASNDASGTPATVSAAPTIDSVTARDRSLELAFTLGSNGGAPITSLEYCLLDCSTSSNWISVASVSSPLRITGLFNGIAYTPSIRAVNAQGPGTSVTAASSTPASAPTAVTISSVTTGAGQAAVLFNAPSSNGGLSITNYEYSLDGGTTWVTPSPTSTATTITVLGLTNGTSYGFAVRAVTASTTGLASAVTYGTPSTTPSVPVSPTLEAASGRINVSLTAPDNGGSPITTYEYALSSNGGAYGAWVSTNSTSTSFMIQGVTNGTAYGVKIRALNINGSGTVYTHSTTVTPVGVPDSPVVTSTSNSQILNSLTTRQIAVNFTEPANNGSAITNYQYSTDNGATWINRTDTTGRLSPIVISKLSTDGTTDLNIDTPYTLKIRAINANGNGDASVAVSARTGGAVDTTAPTVTLSRVAGDFSSSRNLTFLATFSETVSGVTTSDIVRSSGTASCSISSVSAASGTSININVSCTTDGTYQIRINANTVTDGQNTGPTSAVTSNLVTINSVAPTASIQTASATSGSRTLTFPVTFSSSVTGIGYSDFVQASGTASCSSIAVSAASGTTVSFTVLCSTDGTVTMRLLANSVANSYFSAPVNAVDSSQVTIDSSVPTATVASPSTRTSSRSLTYVVTFSETVSGVSASDFVQYAGTASCTTSALSATSGTSITFTVTCSNDGSVQMRLSANSITDGINLGPSAVLNSNMVTVDQIAPSASIASPAVNSKIRVLSYTVDFSEIVTGISDADFVQSAGTATCSTSSVSQASGQSVTFKVTCTSDGTVTMKFLSGSVSDGLYTGPSADVLSREVNIDSTVAFVITPRVSPRSGPVIQPAPQVTPAPRAPTLLNGELPRVTTSAPVIIIDGTATTTQITTLPSGAQQISLSAGASVSLDAVSEKTGKSVSASSSGVMQISHGDSLVIQAIGLQPGSEIEVWLFSTPKLLGTVIVGPDGTASGEFAIPAGLHVGSHTAQIDGIDSTGTEVSVNTALQISEQKASSTVETAGSQSSGTSTITMVVWIGAGALLLALLFFLFFLFRKRIRNSD